MRRGWHQRVRGELMTVEPIHRTALVGHPDPIGIARGHLRESIRPLIHALPTIALPAVQVVFGGFTESDADDAAVGARVDGYRPTSRCGPPRPIVDQDRAAGAVGGPQCAMPPAWGAAPHSTLRASPGRSRRRTAVAV